MSFAFALRLDNLAATWRSFTHSSDEPGNFCSVVVIMTPSYTLSRVLYARSKVKVEVTWRWKFFHCQNLFVVDICLSFVSRDFEFGRTWLAGGVDRQSRTELIYYYYYWIWNYSAFQRQLQWVSGSHCSLWLITWNCIEGVNFWPILYRVRTCRDKVWCWSHCQSERNLRQTQSAAAWLTSAIKLVYL